ncbi:MAG: hypothetical protein V3S46_02140, partial [Nitrospinota bacterium]
MKCPKCNYVSFEHLNECRKCNIDLSAHKSELGIDFPEYSGLDLLSHIDMGGDSKAEGQHEEPAVAVADEEETAEPEEVETAVADETVDTDMSDIGGGIEITGESEGVELSDIGEGSEETATVEISPEEEGQAEVSDDDSGGINFGGFAGGEDETVSIDAADLEEEPKTEASSTEPAGDESGSIDLGGIGDSAEETASLELPEIDEEPAAAAETPEAADVEG